MQRLVLQQISTIITTLASLYDSRIHSCHALAHRFLALVGFNTCSGLGLADWLMGTQRRLHASAYTAGHVKLYRLDLPDWIVEAYGGAVGTVRYNAL